MQEIPIVGFARTPIGKFGGSLSKISPLDLGAYIVKAVLKKYNVPFERVERVVMGENIQTTPRGDPARHVALRAGLPIKVDDYTINMNCASGMNAVVSAARDVLLKERKLIVAGGMESMSQAPFIAEHVRWGRKLGGFKFVDFLGDYILGDAGVMAENVAEKWGISREEQDRFAFESQMKAIAAIDAKKFEAEIVPVPVDKLISNARGASILEDRIVPDLEPDEGKVFKTDEHPRRDTSLEKLSRLSPAFKKDGTVTAGNASGINDGAAAMVLCSEEIVRDLRLEVQARLVAWEAAGVEPMLFGMGPVPAVRKLLDKVNLKIDDIALFEVNEAFAVSTIAVQRELGIPESKLNVNGGAIALGHPVGATGVILMIKLISELQRRGGGYGIATMCIGSGQGMAVLLKVV